MYRNENNAWQKKLQWAIDKPVLDYDRARCLLRSGKKPTDLGKKEALLHIQIVKHDRMMKSNLESSEIEFLEANSVYQP